MAVLESHAKRPYLVGYWIPGKVIDHSLDDLVHFSYI